jgi:copper chaperone
MAATIELAIEGMTCDHCVNAVTGALQEVPGVKAAKVDLDSKSASVEGDQVEVAALIAAVEEEGYEAAVK